MVNETGEILRRLRLQTRSGITSDELFHQWSTLLRLPEDEQLELLVASVVPDLTSEIRKLNNREQITVDFLEFPWDEASVKVATENPRQVGADRVAGATAFHEEFGKGIVVDFGTATTLDVITGKGVYKGGVIFPGIEASATGLSTQAALLPRVPADPPDSLKFSDTVSGLRSGLFYGTAGAVERLIDELISATLLDNDFAVVATGGGGEAMSRLAQPITHVRKNLVVRGLVATLGT